MQRPTRGLRLSQPLLRLMGLGGGWGVNGWVRTSDFLFGALTN